MSKRVSPRSKNKLLIKIGRLAFVAVSAAIVSATTPDRSDPEIQFNINGPVSLYVNFN